MSGRVDPRDVVAAPYRTVDDHRLPWLDELLITAGSLRRCPCGATAPADESSQLCGRSGLDEPQVRSFFEVYRCEPEAVFDVPPLAGGDQPLQIRIAAAGGGTVGGGYADNDWIYEVHLAGTPVCSGRGLHSGSVARTHAQMAAALAAHPAEACGVPALQPHRQRLRLLATDTEHGRAWSRWVR